VRGMGLPANQVLQAEVVAFYDALLLAVTEGY
jgi:hypothetical protein